MGLLEKPCDAELTLRVSYAMWLVNQLGIDKNRIISDYYNDNNNNNSNNNNNNNNNNPQSLQPNPSTSPPDDANLSMKSLHGLLTNFIEWDDGEAWKQR